MSSNIKVISIKPSSGKFNDILSSSDKIKTILKKKLENTTNSSNRHSNTNINHSNTNNISHNHDKFKAQFINRHQTKKKNNFIQDKLQRKRKTMRNVKQDFFETPDIPIIPNKDVLSIFHMVIEKKHTKLTNKFIKMITRKQLILILHSLNIVKKKTKAPTPLLKNLLYNFITSTIHIIKK